MSTILTHDRLDQRRPARDRQQFVFEGGVNLGYDVNRLVQGRAIIRLWGHKPQTVLIEEGAAL